MNANTLIIELAEYERMLASIPAASNNTHDRFARKVYESLIDDARKRLMSMAPRVQH